MAKFMIKASYTVEGAKGLQKDGGSGRKAAVEKMVSSLGGSVESFYFAFGADDVFVIADIPDAVTAAAISFTVNASGAVNASTIPLLTVQDVDAACKKSVSYRAPGK